MTNLTPLRNFINEPHCDLGENAWKLYELIKPMKNARFMDLGVRLGASSAILSIEAGEKENKVHGCDLGFDGFSKQGARFVNEDYMCYMADSVTLGKNWDEDPFDIIFVDTIHTREQVLSELYYWVDHLKEGGYLVFHDSHWEGPGDVIGGVQHERVDVAITDFFNLPTSVREMNVYEDDDIVLEHYQPSFGMTFVKVKSLDAIKRFKEGVNWDQVFERRNWLADLHFNESSSDRASREWGIDLNQIDFELDIAQT